MAFPWIFEANFELGTAAEWDSETDTASQLDFPHFSTLALQPWSTAAPFRGAYVMRTVLSGGTADAFVLEGDIDIAANVLRWAKFDMWISPNFTGTANDTLNIFEVQSSGPVIEATFGLRVVAATNEINFGIGEVTATSFGAEAIQRGKWYTIELAIELDDGVGDDGTIDLYVTRENTPSTEVIHAAQVASLDQAAVIQGVLGVQLHAATTTGTILFSDFRFDDARIYPERDRFPLSYLLTKDGHAFVGPGVIERVELMSGADTDNVATIFDTDSGDTTIAGNIVTELKNTANNELVIQDHEMVIRRGAFVQMSGTTPRVMVHVKRNPMGRSVANIRQLGLKRVEQR